MTDTYLCKRLLKEDRKAFDAIYEKYWKRLFYYAYRIFENKEVCEDVVQEVFVKLWSRATENEIHHLEAYLFKATKYQISNTIRNLKKTTPLDDILPNLSLEIPIDKAYELKETTVLIHRSVERLPDKCKEVYILSREQNLSNKHIALQMNISVRTVEAHLYKALKFIRRSLKEEYYWVFMLLGSTGY